MGDPPEHWQLGLRTALGAIVGDPAFVSGTWWDCTPLEHTPNVGTTRGLWRWRGRMQRREGGAPWAMVQKRLGLATRSPLWPGEPEPTSFGYWRREADALASGHLRHLGPAARVPRTYAIVDVPDAVDIWSEDLGDSLAVAPDLDAIALAARHIGEWQGSDTVRGSIADDAFLCRGFLRCYLKLRDGVDDDIPSDIWEHPLVRGRVDHAMLKRASRVDDKRQELLATLDALPRAMNHNDVWPANIFDASGTTVLIDWTYVGIGALGEDAGNLIPDSILDNVIPVDDATRLREVVSNAYIEGVVAAGFDDDPALVTFAINALAGTKYTWIPRRTLKRIADGSIYEAADHMGISAERLVDARVAGTDVALDMADAAIAAMPDIRRRYKQD